MSSVNMAVVLWSPPEAGMRWLLTKPLAGVPALKRLCLALARSGVETIALWPKDVSEKQVAEFSGDLNDDTRFKATLDIWPETLSAEHNEQVQNSGGPVFVVEGNTVTTQHSLNHFLQAVSEQPANPATRVFQCGDTPAVFLIAPEGTDPVIQYRDDGDWPGAVQPVEVNTEKVFLKTIHDGSSFRKAEQALLEYHKTHYTQLLDVHFNCLFSIPISAFLVRTPVTPNQLTLMGLGIGAVAGWLFSMGDYLTGLIGGILLALTAVWDCCDGDVARLKFMESDFGATLDTICDNLINVFIFTGIAIGVARTQGWEQVMIPFGLLCLGGFSIFLILYLPGGGKGSSFENSALYGVILLLASRNFIYIILGFAVAGRLDTFLWLAGAGSLIFALVLSIAKFFGTSGKTA